MLHRRSIWDEMKKMQARIDIMFEHFFKSEPFFENFYTPLFEDNSKDIISYRRPLINIQK